jgi:phytoene synthase
MSVVDARLCERIARSHTRTFYLASLFLPAEKRRGAFALYAFCRLADDMVDDATLPDAQERLASYAKALNTVFRGTPTHPVFRELAWTARTFELPRAPLDELLDGVARDLLNGRYRTWRDLEEYCAGVASSVGEMCTHVFGVQGTPETLRRAVEHGRTLGTAMQLTNILRDVGDDARRGRVYLPEEELTAHGVAVGEILDGTALRRRDAWSALMRLQIARARSLYDTASPGIALLQRDAQRCASACAMGYAGILDVIERNGFDTFTRRASLGWPARAQVLMRCWLGGGHADGADVTAPADERAAVSTA